MDKETNWRTPGIEFCAFRP